MTDESMRIARYLARCGVASRRKSEEIISAGRVTVNGEVATDLGRQIVLGKDVVHVDGKPLETAEEELTLLHHKKIHVMVTRDDPQGRETVYDSLPIEYAPVASRLVYVGRLDYMSEGLLIMTTDGELAHRLAHPTLDTEKEYLVTLERDLTPEEIAALIKGVDVGDDRPAKGKVKRVEANRYLVTLQEGRNRQIRRMMEAVGLRVRRLQRIRMGGLRLGDLPPGGWARLTAEDLRRLR